jgi:hypothetical protein
MGEVPLYRADLGEGQYRADLSEGFQLLALDQRKLQDEVPDSGFRIYGVEFGV